MHQIQNWPSKSRRSPYNFEFLGLSGDVAERDLENALTIRITETLRDWVRPILGGTANGPRLRGRVLPAGADFQVLRSPELTELDARYALETDDGAVIYVHNLALRHGKPEDITKLNRGEYVYPSAIYFRCAPRFSTAPPEWFWLNNVLAVGAGKRRPDAVEIAVLRRRPGFHAQISHE